MLHGYLECITDAVVVAATPVSRGRRMTVKTAGLALSLSLACLSPLVAGDTLTADDVLSMRSIQNPVLSPDGSRIVFAVNEPLDEGHSKDPTNTELWTIAVNGADLLRLTSNPGADFAPQWSPDGASIFFLSTRRGTVGPQLFAINRDGGESRQLTRHRSPISAFAPAPNGREVAFLAAEPPSPALEDRANRGDDEIVLDSSDTDQNAPLQRLWLLDLVTAKTRQVPIGEVHVTSVSWSPDGSRFLLTVTDDANLDYEWTRARLTVLPVGGGTPTAFCSTRGRLAKPGWLPDGSGISFLGASANGTEQAPSNLFMCREPGGLSQNLTAGNQFTVQGYQWMPGADSVVLCALERNSRYLAKFDVRSKKFARIGGGSNIVAPEFSLSRDGLRVACVSEASKKPPDLWAGLTGQALKQLTHLNPHLERLRYGETEEIDWKAKDGLDITGILVKPVDYQKGKRYPTVVQVHGGPESADLNGFQVAWAQLFAAHGYLTFLPNYRGSVGRGVEYTIANHGDRGGKDFQDILAGIESIVSRGLADPERLGIGGWSYGGFMSAWAITQTNIFKAAVVGVGITDWFSLMGMAPVPIWNAEAHFLAWHYDKPEEYWRFSPVLQVKKAKTPTLLLWGELDPLVPPAQGREFFRGLRHYGVPSEMVVYPREGHGLRERLHRKNAYARVLGWYDRFLGKTNN
ncbi:MAG: S9 family peptidase [Acidimicrobiia bacterium]|nr:S9 family peptidase [Acidimicrobiia bacterium]